MLNRIIAFSLNNRLLVIALAALLLVYGVLTLQSLPVDVFPDLNRPTVTIFSEAEGLAPEEVETLVTLPIETAMNGASGVIRVRSASAIGLSIVWVEFDYAQDIYLARQIVTEKLGQLGAQLPAEIRPVLGPISSIMGEIMLVGLTSETPAIDSLQLRSIADWDIRQRLLAIPGIAQITVIGGDAKQYQVLLDPRRLITQGVSLHQVEEAVRNANVNATGGFLLQDYQEGLIRSLGRVDSLEDLTSSVVAKETAAGVPALTLEQLGTVRLGGPLAKRGDASVNGKPAVILSIQKQPGADTVALTENIEVELKTLQEMLPKGVTLHADLFRQSVFIENAIRNVEHALRDGSLLVVVVLFLFLLNVRTTFITLTAIPLSLVVTAIVFKLFGLSINTMTLGGLAIAIGELVDDAIVDVENVFRRLRENRRLPQPRPPLRVIYEASAEVRNSIVFATVIVILVFIPLFALGGIEGQIFAPLGIAYIVSILASLVVSLTVTPALCSYLLPRMKRMEHANDGGLVRGLKRAQAAVLRGVLPVGKLVLGLTVAACVGAGVLLTTFGKEFLPPFNEGSVTINVLSAPGTSLAESNRIGTIAEHLLLQVPEVSKTGRRTGRAELDDHAEGVHSSEIEVELKPSRRSRAAILADIRQKLDTIPGIAVNIGQPISHRIDHLLSGVRAQLAVKIFGPDLAVLREKAAELQKIMAATPGIVDLSVEKQTLMPQLHIRLDRDRARAHGLMVGEAAEYVELALQGKAVSQIIEGNRLYDVVVRFDDTARADVDAIRAIPIDTPHGQIPLSMIADIEEAKGPNQIVREDVSRRIVVQANVAGRDLVTTVQDVQARVATELQLPPGYFVRYGGQFESQASASKSIALLSLFSFAGMFVVLYVHFQSANLAAQVMVAIPLAFIGAVVGVWLSGGVFSIATLVGFITLTGIAARNGIMMIAHYLHLMRHEGEGFTVEMLIRGTQERLVPVLMTALTAALALIPLVIGGDQPGKEILHPVAVVIFSGLFSSTLLNLVVTPLLFWTFSRNTVARLLSPTTQKEIIHVA
jgi:CzcA family heavy metal efflux pump